MNTDNRPETPTHLEGEALLEWGRVCDELAAAGRLDKADRAVIQLHAETWGLYADAMRQVTMFGAIVKYPNGVPGQLPAYKVARECATQIQKLLADLGLTPAARHKMKTAAADAPAGLPEF